MDDIEAIRQRRLQELQAQQEAAQQDAASQAQAEAQREAAIEGALQKILEPLARERLTRIRMSRPEFAEQVTMQLLALAKGGRLPNILTDADLRRILQQLNPENRDIKITRK